MDRHTDQCSRTDNPEVDPHQYVQLNLTEMQRNSMEKKKIALAANGAGVTSHVQAKNK